VCSSDLTVVFFGEFMATDERYEKPATLSNLW
jgi:hypothetical protein